MDRANSQKKSTPDSEKSKRSKPKQMPHSHDNDLDHDYEQEHSFDLVARVRAAREAAEREMQKFGKVSEYEVRKVYGQRADLNYDDESVPGLPDHPTQQRERVDVPLEREHSTEGLSASEGDKKQGSLDFENRNAQPPSEQEEG